MEDEEEFHYTLLETAQFMLVQRLRSFVLLCSMGASAAPLWDTFQNIPSKDHLEQNSDDPELAIKLSLIEIDWSLCLQGSSLADYGLPFVQDDTTELGRELLSDGKNHQRVVVEEWEP